MGSRITIIDVDVGDVEKLIQDELLNATQQLERDLDTALDTAKSTAEAAQNNTADNLMGTAYTALEKAGGTGVPCGDIMRMIQPRISTASAFTLRMKTLLRLKGHPYRLIRENRQRVPTYSFLPFNQITPSDASPERTE